MIESFKNEETKRIFDQLGSRKLPLDIQISAKRKLDMVHAAIELRDLFSLPGNRFEKLSGDRVGQYSIRINDQWRVCFVWMASNNAADVEIVDYH